MDTKYGRETKEQYQRNTVISKVENKSLWSIKTAANIKNINKNLTDF